MTLFLLFILAIVQGITEFLPISSSAHLVLLHEIGGQARTTDALVLDIAVHLGSIAAVVVFLWPEVRRALTGLGHLMRGQRSSSEAGLAFGLIVATIPALFVGAVLALTGWIDLLRSTAIIGWTMIIFGVLLWVVHRHSPEERSDRQWSTRDAVIMGLWQAVALIPGVSRSGITMTSARYLGFERHAATRVAILMSIPITLATGAVLMLEVFRGPVTDALLLNALVAASLSFIAAYLALTFMMKLLSRVSFTPYVIYRIILGMVLLAIVYA